MLKLTVGVDHASRAMREESIHHGFGQDERGYYYGYGSFFQVFVSLETK